MDQTAAVQQTALEHLQELMHRLLWSVGFLICGGAAAYVFRLKIINFLQRPLHQNLYYTSPMGSFQFVMQVCLLCGVLCALPVLLYNVIRFVEPAFTWRLSHRMVLLVLSASFVLTLMGAAFGYYVTLPAALRFFGSVGTGALHPLISVNEYFSFVLGYLGTFAIIFQIPLVLLFIDHIHPIDPGMLQKKRTFLYVGAFAVSLVMPSSPDPLSQISLAVPIIGLYELSILLIRMAHRKQRRKLRKTQKASPIAAPAAAKPFTFNFDDVEPIMAKSDTVQPQSAFEPEPESAPEPQPAQAVPQPTEAAATPRRSPVKRTNYQKTIRKARESSSDTPARSIPIIIEGQ